MANELETIGTRPSRFGSQPVPNAPPPGMLDSLMQVLSAGATGGMAQPQAPSIEEQLSTIVNVDPIAPQVQAPLAEQIAQEVAPGIDPSANPNLNARAAADIPQGPTVDPRLAEQIAPTIEQTEEKVVNASDEDLENLSEEEEKSLFADWFARPDTKKLLLGFGIGLLKNEGVGGALERGVAMRQRQVDRMRDDELRTAAAERLAREDVREGKESVEEIAASKQKRVESQAKVGKLQEETKNLKDKKPGAVTQKDALKFMSDAREAYTNAQALGEMEDVDIAVQAVLDVNNLLPEDQRQYLQIDPLGTTKIEDALSQENQQPLSDLITIYGPEAVSKIMDDKGI